jgi:hypothetical protein
VSKCFFLLSPGEARLLRSARRSRTAVELIAIGERACCDQIRIGDLLIKLQPISGTHIHVACEPDERACDVMRLWKTPGYAIAKETCEKILRCSELTGRWRQSPHLSANTVWQISVNAGQTEDTLRVRQPLMAYAWAIVHNVIDPLIQQAYGVRVTRGRWSHEPYSTVGLKQACNDIFVSKYDAHAAGGMAAALSGISYHRDDQDFAFIVQLNDPSDFEGGGTVFEHYVGNDDRELLCQLERGGISLHPGFVSHGAPHPPPPPPPPTSNCT